LCRKLTWVPLEDVRHFNVDRAGFDDTEALGLRRYALYVSSVRSVSESSDSRGGSSEQRFGNPLVDIDRSRRRHAAHIDGAS
jgi:hypothetical protein